MEKKQLEDVFNPGGFPDYTYNPRKQLDLEKDFKDYLTRGHKFLSLSGPTKSGKTVLCRKLIPLNEGIHIFGGQIKEESEFWQKIVNQLQLYTSVSKTYQSEKGEVTSGQISGGFNLGIVNIGSNVTGTESARNAEIQAYLRTEDAKTVALRFLNKKQKPVVIDDFHYIPHHVQINIVRALKEPIYEGLRVVIISVPHKAYEANKIESEMTGRIQQLKIPLWEVEELKEIANKGFPFLNIHPNNELAESLAKESFGSPQLMQEFCHNICKINNITETQVIPVKINSIPQASFYKEISDAFASKAHFEMLKHGPRKRKDRTQYKFFNGTEGDVYIAVLWALANSGPITNIRYDELKIEIKNIIDSERCPQYQQVSSALEKMQQISSGSEGRPNLIEWDGISDTLHLLDPYFAFYLKWGICNINPKSNGRTGNNCHYS